MCLISISSYLFMLEKKKICIDNKEKKNRKSPCSNLPSGHLFCSTASMSVPSKSFSLNWSNVSQFGKRPEIPEITTSSSWQYFGVPVAASAFGAIIRGQCTEDDDGNKRIKRLSKMKSVRLTVGFLLNEWARRCQ